MENIRDLLTPFQRGFYCNDQSIAFSYREETIPDKVFLPLFSVLLPISVVILKFWEIQTCVTARYRRSQYKYIFLAGLITFLIFWLLFIVDLIIKLSVGELRPNFLAVCRPNWNEINCTDSHGNPQYVFPIPCNETDNYLLQKIRTSFFSGHASLSAFSATAIIMYLNEICSKNSTCMSYIRLILQLLFALLSFYMGLSRIWDHMHHWWDVAIGFLYGIVVGYIVKKQVLDTYFSDDNSHNVNGMEMV